MRNPDPKVEAEVEALASDSVGELKEKWQKLYGNPAPKRFSRHLLELAVAYRIQENAYGGLSRQTKELLRRYAEEIRTTGTLTIAPTTPKLKAGTRLVKEWQGNMHVVTAMDDGFVYREERYGSLSEIARKITRVRRSGPAFFGLKGERKRRSNSIRIETS